jgi:uncharacterized protein (TIGR02453 family)
MNDLPAFDGFPRECVKFLLDLKANNNKAWFEAHRREYEEYVLSPAQAFVVHMGEKLKAISPNIHADPRVDKSIFRIYRDIRFSKDKSPFKTSLAMWFWEGSGARMDCSGYYFHLEPPHLLLGMGIYMFSDALLRAYRDSVVDPEYGPDLTEAIHHVALIGAYQIGGKHYKKVPPGYDPAHPNVELLLYNGLTAGIETEIPEELYSLEILDICYHKYEDMSPLHKWLLGLTERVAG